MWLLLPLLVGIRMSSADHIWLDVLRWKARSSALFQDYLEFQRHALMNRDSRAINKLKRPTLRVGAGACGGVDKPHDSNVSHVQPGRGGCILHLCVCPPFLTSASRTAVFLQERRRHVRHSQISRPRSRGPSLLLSSDCFCMSQSLQDIRTLFTAMSSPLNCKRLSASFPDTEQNIINYLMSTTNAGGLLLSA